MDLRTLPLFVTPALGASCWVQLAALPVVAGRAGPVSAVCAVAALGALVPPLLSTTSPARAALSSGVLFPLALAASAATAQGSGLRIDAPGQAVVALTTAAYLGAVAVQWSASRPRLAVSSVGHDVRELGTPAPPPLRGLAMAVLVGVAACLCLVAPLAVVASAGQSAHAVGGVLRGRAALVVAGGLALSMAWILVGGAALLRKGPAVPRSASRAWFYLCAAAVAFVMRVWLDHAR